MSLYPLANTANAHSIFESQLIDTNNNHRSYIEPCYRSSIQSQENDGNTEEQNKRSHDTVEPNDSKHSNNTLTQYNSSDWLGWAEVENDPQVFSTIVQDWGLRDIEVNDIVDLDQILLTEDDTELLGLIFLSRWLPPDTEAQTRTNSQNGMHVVTRPWFANQISKFSCGTVALLNILMNSSTQAPILQQLSSQCENYSAKERGMAIDSNATLRIAHNGFSTMVDRQTVDTMLQEDARNSTKRQTGVRKRKRKRAAFTRKKKRSIQYSDDDGDGYHFVAYIEHKGRVWKLDGLQRAPQDIGSVSTASSWKELVAQYLMTQTQDMRDNGFEYSLMSVSRRLFSRPLSEERHQRQGQAKLRRQDDWTPLIRTLLEIHAEKGDLDERLKM